MIASILIGGLIALYSFFVIRKRMKEIKAGKLCSCSCEGCSGCAKKVKN